MKKWRKTPKGIAITKKYNSSIKGKAAVKRYHDKPEIKEKIRIRQSLKWNSLSSLEKKKIGKKLYKNNKIKHPWSLVLSSCKSRCSNPKQDSWPYYGGKGIKCLLTKIQIKELWFRDNASSMKIPSIDRLNSDGHYEFSNCRFIEKSENVSRANLGKTHSDDALSNGLSPKSIVCVLLHDKEFYQDYIEKNCGAYKKDYFLAKLIEEIKTSKDIIDESNWCDLCQSDKCCNWKMKTKCQTHMKLLWNSYYPLRNNKLPSINLPIDKDMRVGV